MVILGSEHHVDIRRAADDLLAFRLPHAATDRNQHPAAGFFFFRAQLPDSPQIGIDFFFRFLADMAGVEHHQIGILRICRIFITKRRHHIRHTRGIIDVHLASVGFNIDLLGHRRVV